MFPRLGEKVKRELAFCYIQWGKIKLRVTKAGNVGITLYMPMPRSYDDTLPKSLGFYKVNQHVVNSWMSTNKEWIILFLKVIRPQLDKCGFGPEHGLYVDRALKILKMPRCMERRNAINSFRAHQKRFNIRKPGRPKDTLRIVMQQSRRAREIYEKTKEGQQALETEPHKITTLNELLEHDAVKRLKEKYADKKPEESKQYVTLIQAQTPPDDWEPEGN